MVCNFISFFISLQKPLYTFLAVEMTVEPVRCYRRRRGFTRVCGFWGTFLLFMIIWKLFNKNYNRQNQKAATQRIRNLSWNALSFSRTHFISVPPSIHNLVLTGGADDLRLGSNISISLFLIQRPVAERQTIMLFATSQPRTTVSRAATGSTENDDGLMLSCVHVPEFGRYQILINI